MVINGLTLKTNGHSRKPVPDTPRDMGTPMHEHQKQNANWLQDRITNREEEEES